MNGKESLITRISWLKNPFKRATIDAAKTFKGQTGIEIGGPSKPFDLRSFFPVYLYAGKIDGVNFSNTTVWEGEIKEGNSYQYTANRAKGHQYIDEAAALATVPDNHYDFLLSCHSLEHVANPIQALKRWNAVLKPGGRLCLILPDKRHTFDHNRPYTSFEHLLQDYQNKVTEQDSTHFDEVIRLHDLTKDREQTKAELTDRTKNNYTNRCVHHHVFSFELIEQLLNYCGFKVDMTREFAPFHLFTLATKIN